MSPNPEAAAVRDLLDRERHGVLSTILTRPQAPESRASAFPFGSITPYALSSEGDPILLLSEIAEHAKNLRRDPRASLFVADSEAAADPQAGARVTLLGRGEPAGESEVAGLRDAYLGLFPRAAGYFDAHAFTIFVLRVERVRWIAGFGSMGWLERGDLFRELPARPAGAKKRPARPRGSR
jgi:putative heme iron utilization protein